MNFKKTFISIALISSMAVLLSACSDTSKPNVELIQDMMESPSLKPQEYDKGGVNDGAMRVPPEGTQPVGFQPYKYATDIEGSVSNKNLMSGDYSEETLKVGIKYYTIHCSICHGANGEGGLPNISVVEKMALKPPSLLSDKINGWTDGQIYHVITMGQGVMGPYASHIPQKYRWQVVNYIRHLQGKGK